MLSLYNTLSRKQEPFVPRNPGQVGLYVCGPTVYDYFHIGNARTFTVFDMVYRWLRVSGYQVKYVRNITDVDDKIIERAAKRGITTGELTREMTQAMHDDFAKLKLLNPDVQPTATSHIAEMLAIIQRLTDKGLAYRANNGDVYYAVRGFDGYGKLSRKSLDDLRAGERVAVADAKHDPLDFVLWKSAKSEEPADVKWNSPWGEGRPGWHIECSAMACKHLGEQFDIHGGGWDLQFPHHENEIAQTEGATGKPWVTYWMHAAFLNMDNEKMSKSLGNVWTTREIIGKLDAVRGGELLRFFLLRAHYRSELNYTWDGLIDDAQKTLLGFYTALKDVPPADIGAIDWNQPFAKRFREAMDDDFNTPIAFAVLHELRAEVNKTKDAKLSGLLKALGGTLGFLQDDPQKFVQGTPITLYASSVASSERVGGVTINASVTERSSVSDKYEATVANPTVDGLIAERAAAKQSKNFARADEIRKQLEAQGIVLEDKPGGVTEWRRR